VGAIVFGNDYAFGRTPTAYRPNVQAIDLGPASGEQWFAAPATDINKDGELDVVHDVWAMQLFFGPYARGYPCSGGSGCVGGHSITPAGTIGYTNFFIPEWRNVGEVGQNYPPRTYDYVIDRMNTTFAAQGGTGRNVAHLFSAGDAEVSLGADSPLMRAVAAGTIIHAFTLPSRRYTTDILIDIDGSASMGDEQGRIRQLTSNLANALVASDLDFRVRLSATIDYFASTVLAGNQRYFFEPTGSTPAFIRRADALSHVLSIKDTSVPALPYNSSRGKWSVGNPWGEKTITIQSPFTSPVSVSAGTDGTLSINLGDPGATCANAPNRGLFTQAGTSALGTDSFVSVCEADWSRVVDTPFARRRFDSLDL